MVRNKFTALMLTPLLLSCALALAAEGEAANVSIFKWVLGIIIIVGVARVIMRTMKR